MKPNERVRAVYQGRTPDRVPLMLDVSHWYMLFTASIYEGKAS